MLKNLQVAAKCNLFDTSVEVLALNVNVIVDLYSASSLNVQRRTFQCATKAVISPMTPPND